MTPRQADVAFVLEGVPGVRGVFAVTPGGSHKSIRWEFAIEVAPEARQQAFAHYMLLRVLTHEECARVHWFCSQIAPGLEHALVPLHLSDFERDAARSRVRPVEPFSITPAPAPQPAFQRRPRTIRAVFVIDEDDETERIVCDAVGTPVHAVTPVLVANGLSVFADLIVCDASEALGPNGILSKLTSVERAACIVVANDASFKYLRRRTGPVGAVLRKPLKLEQVRAAIDSIARPKQGVPNPRPPRPVRSLRVGSATEPMRLLLVDIDPDVAAAVRKIFAADAVEVVVASGRDAVNRAFTEPFQFVFCGVRSALANHGFFARVGRDDYPGLRRVVVLSLDCELELVRERLPWNRILRLPIDEMILRALVDRTAPKVAERAAMAAIPDAPPLIVAPAKNRRLAVLVVDDELETQILFAAGAPSDEADIALAKTSLEAFTHVVERPVDVLVISAAMRSDGAEPFYRVLWRMKPELKARTVLVTGLADVSASPRVVRRPLSRAALAAIVARGS